ncbi:MAG: hypothetical protein ACI9WC_001367 [Arenicella sp.]|jgi:hypothetical protein
MIINDQRHLSLTSLLGLLVLLAQCAGLQTSSAQDVAERPISDASANTRPTSEVRLSWEAISQEFVDDYYQHHPSFAAFQGVHRFDGLLPDWSRQGIALEIDRLKSWRTRLGTYALRSNMATFDWGSAGGGALTKEDIEFEIEYLLAKIAQDLFWLEDAQWPFRNPDFYFNWMMGDIDFDLYVSRPYAPQAQRLLAFIKYCRALPMALQQIDENLSAPIAKPYSQYGANRFRGMADFMTTQVPQIFAGVINDDNSHEFNHVLQTAINSLNNLAFNLEARAASKVSPASFAIGPLLFEKMLLQTEGINLSLLELQAIGEAELARNLALLKSACAGYAPNQKIADCVTKNAAVKPKSGAVVEARLQLRKLKQFIVANEIVSVPGNEQAEVAIAPDYAIGWGAYIQSPGPHDRSLASIYYIAPPDPKWTKKEQFDYQVSTSDLLFTSVHEVWPGHFLHAMHANRGISELRQVFHSYAFSEGWAHYTEEMMWDAGYGNRDHAIHIGQLSNALLRNVRFLVALRLHTRGMTPAEAELMFIQQGFQNAALARDETLRAQYEPTVLNYLMGKILIVKLRNSWMAKNPGNHSQKSFHNALLSLGGPPIPLAGKALGLND